MDCLSRIIGISKNKKQLLCQEKLVQKNHKSLESIPRSLCAKASLETFQAHERKRNKQLNTIEQGLF